MPAKAAQEDEWAIAKPTHAPAPRRSESRRGLRQSAVVRGIGRRGNADRPPGSAREIHAAARCRRDLRVRVRRKCHGNKAFRTARHGRAAAAQWPRPRRNSRPGRCTNPRFCAVIGRNPCTRAMPRGGASGPRRQLRSQARLSETTSQAAAWFICPPWMSRFPRWRFGLVCGFRQSPENRQGL